MKLTIDGRLIEQAKNLGGHKTKSEAVKAALDEYIRHRKQQEILSLFGTIGYRKDFSYKRERSKRS